MNIGINTSLVVDGPILFFFGLIVLNHWLNPNGNSALVTALENDVHAFEHDVADAEDTVGADIESGITKADSAIDSVMNQAGNTVGGAAEAVIQGAEHLDSKVDAGIASVENDVTKAVDGAVSQVKADVKKL